MLMSIAINKIYHPVKVTNVMFSLIADNYIDDSSSVSLVGFVTEKDFGNKMKYCSVAITMVRPLRWRWWFWLFWSSSNDQNMYVLSSSTLKSVCRANSINNRSLKCTYLLEKYVYLLFVGILLFYAVSIGAMYTTSLYRMLIIISNIWSLIMQDCWSGIVLSVLSVVFWSLR